MELNNKLRIAFVVGSFPLPSETFIINQVADLIDKGVSVQIFSFKRGGKNNISERYFKYNMDKLVSYLDVPESWIERFLFSIHRIISIFLKNPFLLFRVFNFKKYGRNSFSLKILFWVYPLVEIENKIDLIHCHFGTVANKFLIVKEILKLKKKILCTFYGYDVSYIFKNKPKNYYDRLKKECSLYFVMSRDMKERVVAAGFPSDKVEVLPVSIDVSTYSFKERNLNKNNSELNIVSVGRFVEKKGFDDLLLALSIIKKDTNKKFKCYIIGGGVMESFLKNMVKELKLEKEVFFKGFMPIESIIDFFYNMDLFVQPSKTSKDGDME